MPALPRLACLLKNDLIGEFLLWTVSTVSSVAVRTVVWNVDNHKCSSRGRPTATSHNIATDSAVGKVINNNQPLASGVNNVSRVLESQGPDPYYAQDCTRP